MDPKTPPKTQPKSLSERLDVLVATLTPKGVKAPHPGYSFHATGDGRESVRVIVDPATGEFRSGVGKTKADAIADLERKAAK